MWVCFRVQVSYQTECEGGLQQGLRWLQWSLSSSCGSLRQQSPAQASSTHRRCWLVSARKKPKKHPTPAVSALATRQQCGDIPHSANFSLCCRAWLWLTRLRRWSEASVLEDLEVFIAEEMVLEEVWVREPCLVRSWRPGLGSPTLVAPVFIMAARHGQNLWFDRYYRGKIRNCCLTKIG